MSASKRTFCNVPVSKIFLYPDNPRHEPYEAQARMIDYLCRKEEVLPLATDIAKEGLNPLELFGLTPIESTSDEEIAYFVGEGNRRMCAIKLLADPDLSPADLRDSFFKLTEKSQDFGEVPCVIFEDKDDLDKWLDRIHLGPQGGVGRKPWNSDQKTRRAVQRNSKQRKNRIALEILDYAENNGLINKEDRANKITTVQRYFDKASMRQALGIKVNDAGEIKFEFPKYEFDVLLRKFFDDLLNDERIISSRNNKAEIDAYAQEFVDLLDQLRKKGGSDPIEPSGPIDPVEGEPKGGKKGGRGRPPSKGSTPKKLTYDNALMSRLKQLKGWKLRSLYYSITNIDLKENTPLLAIGVWALVETLSANAGRNDQTSFGAFFSKERLKGYGFTSNDDVSALRAAIDRIHAYGNTTKHHDVAAAFNDSQLANDLDVLTKLLLKCADDAISKEK